MPAPIKTEFEARLEAIREWACCEAPERAARLEEENKRLLLLLAEYRSRYGALPLKAES